MRALLDARTMFDREFLNIRARLLEVAAALDRVDRAAGRNKIGTDDRWPQVSAAVRVLCDGAPDRAERVEMVFSDPYDPNWRTPSSR